MNKEHFLEQYGKLSEDELLAIYINRQHYSEVAILALNEVIDNRGGLIWLLQQGEIKAEKSTEKERIRGEVKQLRTDDTTDEFLYKMISSDVLSPEELKNTVAQSIAASNIEKADTAVKPRTIIAGILGAILAAIVGGILWGLHMMWSGRIILFLGVGLVLVCYHIIRAATKQSYKNATVLLFTILAVIAALLIGEYMWDTFGLQR